MRSTYQNNVGLRAPELGGAGPWLNWLPHSLKELRGRVVLLDFWTYTCVNCLRTLPHLKHWHAEYAERGLVVIGVHTPEFDFERSVDNVEAVIRREGIPYPVLLDNDRRLWQAYTNRYWPTKYLVDAKGIIRHEHAGEGGYADFERRIQDLLREANPGISLPPVEVTGAEETMPHTCSPATSELYCGYYRGRLGNTSGYERDRIRRYEAPAGVEHDPSQDGVLFLRGPWEAAADYLRYARHMPNPGDHLGFRYHAFGVNVVARPRNRREQQVRLTQDGKPLAREVAGSDVTYGRDGQSYLAVAEPRMYSLVRDACLGSHRLELTPLSDKVELYAFTFDGCPTADRQPEFDADQVEQSGRVFKKGQGL